MQLRSRKAHTVDKLKHEALPAGSSVYKEKCNGAMPHDSGAVESETATKGENEVDNVAESEDETLHNVAKGEEPENMTSEHIAKGEDQGIEAKQTLHHDLTGTDNEALESEYIAKSEEEDIEARQALLNNANQDEGEELDDKRVQTELIVYEVTQDEEMGNEQKEDNVFIKGEEVKSNQFDDAMDMDELSETEEANTGTEVAMYIAKTTDNTSVAVNTNAENDIRDKMRTVIHQNENEGGLAYRPEPASRNRSDIEDEKDNEPAIKEETKKLNVSFEFSPDPVHSEYTYQCRKCPQQTNSFVALLEHFENIHKLRYKSRAIRRMDLEPYVNDPNFYCSACERSFQNDQKYRNHLKNVHYILLRPMIDKNSGIIPILEDPNNYCCSCKRTYNGKFLYRLHLRKFHNMKIPPVKVKTVKNPAIQPDWDDPKYFCKSCNYKYPSRFNYHDHCRTIHRINLPSLTNPDIAPDPNNPDNHCIACNKTYKLKYYYRRHLALFHGNRDFFRLKNPRQESTSNLQPDINDPNFYCRVCDKKYARKWDYQYHLLAEHQIGKPFQKTNMIPEEDDPNHFCRACGRGYATREAYRNHLRRVHHMQLKSLIEAAKERGVFIIFCFYFFS